MSVKTDQKQWSEPAKQMLVSSVTKSLFNSIAEVIHQHLSASPAEIHPVINAAIKTYPIDQEFKAEGKEYVDPQLETHYDHFFQTKLRAVKGGRCCECGIFVDGDEYAETGFCSKCLDV